ncbi:hypothetical protein FF011L_27890 [Roseimaritima multifibrata]|uniref:Uncharacterized protein n=1 Tax=Roseimaritima multifibrata TaxID=1930274 RepID=A0A517MGJ7_9BACT|nr:hypothetical protein FF011L_27890 [Roseimaritima multifibrata]
MDGKVSDRFFDRDGIVKYDIGEVGDERRGG